MPSASGIRAGSAYVELAVNDSKLVKGLLSAARQLRDFGAGLRDLGASITLIGAGVVTPLVALAKNFADAGGELGRFQEKTGLGLDAINGLMEAARQADVPLELLSSGMRHLQKAIGGGSKETEDAFARLGTSAAELSKKTPEAALALLADRLKQVTDSEPETPWELTYRFAAQPNRADIEIGDISGISKLGWDYMWVRYAETEDADSRSLVKRPIAVYVERVYDTIDFSILGLD